MPSVRQIAAKILLAVEQGAHSTNQLERWREGLPGRDANLLTELVLGVLRRRAQVDWLVEQNCRVPLVKFDPEVLAALRLGAYQLRFLDRIPPHAAIYESVELVKQAGFKSAMPLVNALLRRMPPLPSRFPEEWRQYSMPEWLWSRWVRNYGEEQARLMAQAALTQPEDYVRSAGPAPGLEPTDIPGCYRLKGTLPAGARYQDVGSQAIVPLLQLACGHRFADLCAAPGNKTLQALETPGVHAVACDASARRMDSPLLAGVDRVVLDASEPLPFGVVFDRILLDAPCSGTGTLARNPEIRWRLRPEDLTRHQTRQKQMLAQALGVLKAGGTLVYSTCSLEKEENEEVVQSLCPERVTTRMQRLPGRDPGEGFFAAVIPVGPGHCAG